MFKVSQDVTLQRVSDLVCTAIETPQGDWCRLKRTVTPPKVVFRSSPNLGKGLFPHIDYPLNHGGAAIFEVEDKDGETREKTLDLQTIAKGLQIMAEKHPKHWADFMAENDDAITGDVFLQCALLGEVIYG